jgi:rod shape determining protein RodA
MFEKRYFRYFDWINFLLTIVLMVIGLLFVFSATYKPTRLFSLFFKKQMCGAISGLCIYMFFCIKDLRVLNKIGYLIYIIILGLLFYTFLNGWLVMGAKRWIPLYFFRFQPSELAKLFLPVFIAQYFSKQNLKTQGPLPKKTPLKTFLLPLFAIFISFFLILRQPDLGTSLLILFSGLILLWFIGIDKKFFIISSLIVLVSTPFLWTKLKPYQKQRIMVLLGQGSAKKERYQMEQSKIAIGSGGITGKGFLKGTQNKLAFLPEDHTDFIFSVICEELGLLGALLVLLLFSALFTRIMFITIQTRNFFDQIIAIGLLSHLMLSFCINIGMGVGILPIVGIPLPLFSYGITNLWISLASLGWLNNIAIRRFYY